MPGEIVERAACDELDFYGRGLQVRTIVREGDRWALSAAVETVLLPPTLHGLLLSRVDRLPVGASIAIRGSLAAALTSASSERLMPGAITPPL